MTDKADLNDSAARRRRIVETLETLCLKFEMLSEDMREDPGVDREATDRRLREVRELRRSRRWDNTGSGQGRDGSDGK